MAFTYENVEPTLIENTTMQKRLLDGVHKQYLITANEGYVLHDQLLDHEVLDPDSGEPTGEIILRYYQGTRTVAASYDFVANPREFYAVLRSAVPEDNICGVGKNHEVM
jgi:hypothetical protein